MRAAGEDSATITPGQATSGPTAMASGAPGERLREEARCPVCLDFLQDPVSVACGHSFCLRCISEFCEKSASAQGGLYACPQCRGPFALESFRPNRQLASLVDSVRQLGLGAGPLGARQCARHGEDLSLFCEEDQDVLCWVCDTTPEHRSHHTAPLQDAARRYQVRAGVRDTASAGGEARGRAWSHGPDRSGLSPRCWWRAQGQSQRAESCSEGLRALLTPSCLTAHAQLWSGLPALWYGSPF